MSNQLKTERKRQRILDKTKGRCSYCGKVLADEPWHMDHAIPQRQRGRGVMANLFPACSACNKLKGPRTVDQFRDRLPQRLLDATEDNGMLLYLRLIPEDKAEAVRYHLNQLQSIMAATPATFYIETFPTSL